MPTGVARKDQELVAPPEGVSQDEAIDVSAATDVEGPLQITGEVTSDGGTAAGPKVTTEPPPARSTLPEIRRVRWPDEQEVAIRQVALEGYEEQPPAAPEVKLTLDQRIRILMLELNRRERRLLVGALAAIAIVGLLIGGYFTFTTVGLVFTRSTPVKPTVLGPEPSRVELPGGWSFVLAKGRVERSQWDPVSAEWLEGTDVCRWVALPWSLQLEAVVRTLKANDEIVLTMSNTDQLVYRVKSIHDVNAREIGTLDQNTPCLLVVLANSNSSKRWVVTAVP
jgi:hypothetical protein